MRKVAGLVVVGLCATLGLGGGSAWCQQPELVSVSLFGSSGNNESDHARISLNGRWVVFSSRATNLVPNDGNGWIDTFRSEVPNWGDWGCGALDIFSDGFESGDTSAWSSVGGGP